MTILSSKDNSNIKNAVKLRKSAKYRRESGLFIAEGVRICMDAMLSKACIDTFSQVKRPVRNMRMTF